MNENIVIKNDSINSLIKAIETDEFLGKDKRIKMVYAVPNEKNATTYVLMAGFARLQRDAGSEKKSDYDYPIAMILKAPGERYIANLVIDPQKDFANEPEDAALIKSTLERVIEIIRRYELNKN